MNKVRKLDKNGLLLCDLQAKTFEAAVDMTSTSSEIFIRRFMNSRIVKSMDDISILQRNVYEKDILERIEEEYGKSQYGSVKYSNNEMYWIGYIYRYFAYVYRLSSIQVYKIVKPKELRGLFIPYHTMDPAQAIERILEAKGMLTDNETELNRQFEIYKRIRSSYSRRKR